MPHNRHNPLPLSLSRNLRRKEPTEEMETITVKTQTRKGDEERYKERRNPRDRGNRVEKKERRGNETK